MANQSDEVLEALGRLVGFSLAARQDTSLQRDLLKALNKHTEHYAYMRVLPYSPFPSADERFLRIAGLIASSSLPHEAAVGFGHWARKHEQTSTETRLLRLMNLPFAQAVEELQRLLRLSEGKSGFDWHRLARTLYFWGEVSDDKALTNRQSILRDYYRAQALDASVSKEDEHLEEKRDEE